MIRLPSIALAAVAALFACGALGCKKNAKHPTPIPGYLQSRETNLVYGAPGSNGRTTNPLGTRGGQFGTDSGVDSRNIDSNNTGGAGTRDPNALVSQPDSPIDGWPQNREAFQASIVYFEFDKSTVRKSEMAKIAAVAEALKANPTHAVLVEGHCDERGTDGYNLALGERRALSAREVLLNLGISAERLRTISYGETRPADPGHDDTAWGKNRRAEFILLTPPSAR